MGKMAFTAKSKGQDENVVPTNLFLRLVTKLSMVISGIRMKSPSPTVVWSAISAAGNHPSQASTSTTAQLPNCHSSMHRVDCPGRGPTWTGAVAASWAGCAGALSLEVESRTPPLLQPAWPSTPEYLHHHPHTHSFEFHNHWWYN